MCSPLKLAHAGVGHILSTPNLPTQELDILPKARYSRWSPGRLRTHILRNHGKPLENQQYHDALGHHENPYKNPSKMNISDGPCPEKGLRVRTAPGAGAFATGRRGLPSVGTRIFEATSLWRPRAWRRSHRQTVQKSCGNISRNTVLWAIYQHSLANLRHLISVCNGHPRNHQKPLVKPSF